MVVPINLGCNTCGGPIVEIRGKNPGDKRRRVCPTCLMERLEMINEISANSYGTTYREQGTTVYVKKNISEPKTTIHTAKRESSKSPS